MQLHFEASGEGPPLVILHGLFGSLDNWRPVSRKLSERFRVLAVDQRNHGRSAHSFEMDYPIMAGDLVELLDQQGLSRAFVLGHSMGGKVAMCLALLHPELVKSLIVVDIAPGSAPPRHRRIIAGMRALDLSAFESRQQMEAALAPAVPDSTTRQFLLKNISRTPSDGFRWKIGLEEIDRNYSRLLEGVASVEPFRGPTLFLRGDSSDYLTPADLEPIHSLFPLARLETVVRSGHLVHVENPNAFLAAVKDFLEQA